MIPTINEQMIVTLHKEIIVVVYSLMLDEARKEK